MILAALALAAAPLPPRGSERRAEAAQVAVIDDIIRKANLAGEVLVARGDRILLDRAYGTVAPGGGPKHTVGATWRLASITKQITAALVVREFERDTRQPIGASLDMPLGDLNDWDQAISTRAYLTHHSGLANPDTTPAGPDGMPAFYKASAPDLAYCRSKPTRRGAPFAYNNCDYLVIAQAFDVGGKRQPWPAEFRMARPADRSVPGFVHGDPEAKFELASFGAAGGLIGTARSVFDFDRQLMTGKLLKPASLAELWKPEGNGSYQALGQWVFPGKLAGCAAPKRIVQRDGEILGVQTRNFIFPDDDLVVIVFTNRSSDDFRFGEVWEGKGFTYDLLSAAACGLRPN